VHAADFLDLTEEDFDRVLRVNLKGAFLCAQAPLGAWWPRTRGPTAAVA